MALRVAPDRDHLILFDSNRLPQAGRSSDNRVLSRHNLPFSLSAWGLGTFWTEGCNHCSKQQKHRKRAALILRGWKNLMSWISSTPVSHKQQILATKWRHRCPSGLADSVKFKGKNYTFYWQWRISDEPREHAVGNDKQHNEYGWIMRQRLRTTYQPSLPQVRLPLLVWNTHLNHVLTNNLFMGTFR